MENNILTAKEWLEEEGLLNEELKRKEYYVIEAGLMERYANYKSKMLEAKILWFRNNINFKIKELEISSDWETGYEREALEKLIENYDKHFSIEVK